MYIGSSINLWKIFYQHINNKSSNIYLPRRGAFNKYGLENFTFSVLEFIPIDINFTEQELRLINLEQKYLNLIDDKYNINP